MFDFRAHLEMDPPDDASLNHRRGLQDELLPLLVPGGEEPRDVVVADLQELTK